MLPTRHLRWSALTCRLRETDIYLGVAASLDDAMSEVLSARAMVAFPLHSVMMTSRDSAPTPFRMYAVRDPGMVRIEPEADAPDREPGFQRVRLTLHLHRRAGPGELSAAEAKARNAGVPASAARTDRPVMAFLMTIGLPISEEDAFFGTVVRDFISRSWMTFPALLRELGCTTAEHLAEGECDACPN